MDRNGMRFMAYMENCIKLRYTDPLQDASMGRFVRGHEEL